MLDGVTVRQENPTQKIWRKKWQEFLAMKGSFAHPSGNGEIDCFQFRARDLEFRNFAAGNGSSRPSKRAALINFVIRGRVYR